MKTTDFLNIKSDSFKTMLKNGIIFKNLLEREEIEDENIIS